jgi:hypothetical protein
MTRRYIRTVGRAHVVEMPLEVQLNRFASGELHHFGMEKGRDLLAGHAHPMQIGPGGVGMSLLGLTATS